MRLSSTQYFLLSGVLFALTIPMYRYMWEHRSDSVSQAVLAQQNSVVPMSTAMPALSPPLPAASSAPLVFNYDQTLPPGWRCSAAGGLAYRVVPVLDGSLVIEPLIVHGQRVHCMASHGSLIKGRFRDTRWPR